MRIVATVALAILLALLRLDVGYAETRVALVIGNGAYENAPRLPNPRNDAEDVAASLKRSGFETIVGLDMSRLAMEDAAIRFARAARSADVAMFYFSGHAIQVAGVNYLAPIDLKLTDENDLRRMVRLDDVVADLQQAKNLRILVVDACRDNPLAEELKRSIGATRAMSVQRGLAKIDAPQGMIVAYATQAGRTADDGHGRNSPYTAAFLRHIEAQEEIGTVFRRMSADVYEATSRKQLPELSLSLVGEFYLRGNVKMGVAPLPVPPPAAKPDPCAPAESHWKSAEAIGTIAAFEDHIGHFPSCAFAGLAKARLGELKNKIAAVTPVPPPVSPAAPSGPPLNLGSTPTRLGQYGDWGSYAALLNGRKICYVITKPISSENSRQKRSTINILISNRPLDNIKEGISIVLGYNLQRHDSATLSLGSSTVVLWAEGGNAWIKNTTEEMSLIAAMRNRAAMRDRSDLVVKGTSSSGFRTIDHYSLRGLPQALDRSAEQCR